MPESVHITIDDKPNPALWADGSRSSVIQPVPQRQGGPALSRSPSWAFSLVFRTLPPLASVQTEPANDPATAMLAAARPLEAAWKSPSVATAIGGSCRALEAPRCAFRPLSVTDWSARA